MQCACVRADGRLVVCVCTRGVLWCVFEWFSWGWGGEVEESRSQYVKLSVGESVEDVRADRDDG